jgi:hypothetical protein
MEDTVEQCRCRVKLSYRGSESGGPVYVLLPRQAGRSFYTHLSRPPPRNPFERPEGGEKMAVGVVVRARWCGVVSCMWERRPLHDVMHERVIVFRVERVIIFVGTIWNSEERLWCHAWKICKSSLCHALGFNMHRRFFFNWQTVLWLIDYCALLPVSSTSKLNPGHARLHVLINQKMSCMTTCSRQLTN